MPAGTPEYSHYCQAEHEQLNPSTEQELPEETKERQELVRQHLPGTPKMLGRNRKLP